MEENKRLFYVAATRAQIKLYLPFYLSEKKAPGWGRCVRFSPPPFWTPFRNGKEATLIYGSEKKIAAEVSKEGSIQRQPHPFHFPFSMRKTTPFFPVAGNFRNRRIRLESFSSLHHKMARDREEQEKIRRISGQ